MALTDYEKELFKKELPKYYTVQVLNSSNVEIDFINANRMDYESAKFIENMANSEAGFNFGLSFSSVFSCTFHELETGLTVSDYKDAKIIVNLNLDYVDDSEVNQAATILIGTFWIDSILLTNKKNKQYELVAYDYINKIDWKDIDLKPYNLGMPLLNQTIWEDPNVVDNYVRIGRDVGTSLAYMSQEMMDDVDLGDIQFNYIYDGSNRAIDIVLDPGYISDMSARGFIVNIGGNPAYPNATSYNYLGKGNYNIAYRSIQIRPTDVATFTVLKKYIHAYDIFMKTSEIQAITSFYTALPNFFSPRIRAINTMYTEESNFTSEKFDFVADFEVPFTPGTNYIMLEIPVLCTKLYTTTPTNRYIELLTSASVRVSSPNLYTTFIGEFLDNENEYDLAINNNGVLNQKDFFDGMAKWFLYNISANKTGALQVKRLYDLDLAMSNYGRAENDPIIPSINYLYPNTGLYPNAGLYPQGEKELIKVNQIKDTSIGQYLKGFKKLIFKSGSFNSSWNVSKSGIHTIIDADLGTLSIAFDDVVNDSELIIDASSFSDNFIRFTYLNDPQFVFDDKRGYILMSALQYLNRAFGQVEFSSVPYLQAGEFVTVNLDDESVNVLIVKNELNGISVAQSQTITGM